MSDPQPSRRYARTIRVTPAAAGGDGGPLRAWLTVIRGGQDLGVQAQVQEICTIGRSHESTLVLQDLSVSWDHVRIAPRGPGEYIIEDVGSTNGTRIGGQSLEQARLLHDGDKILLGETVVRFSLSDAMDVDFLQEIAQLVGTDPLTGLESKRRFDDAFDYALKVGASEGESVAMLMMDMDGVKQINDTHGHKFGAYVIGATGRVIAEHMTAGGHACRFGGDEFSAFLPGVGKEEACRVAEGIRAAVEGAGFEKDGIPLRPTISIGVGCFPGDGEDPMPLLEHADAALYRAKAAGKNCVCT
ncbi:MAG: GGDEF domain-containing protein [Planctomycetota bacterium]|nr:GGDEF domain-containing protein [Planctomycetota bacterium]